MMILTRGQFVLLFCLLGSCFPKLLLAREGPWVIYVNGLEVQSASPPNVTSGTETPPLGSTTPGNATTIILSTNSTSADDETETPMVTNPTTPTNTSPASPMNSGTTSTGSISNEANAMEEVGLSTAEFIRLRGFRAEEHKVTTSDGYNLNLVRATNPLINEGQAGLRSKSVVLFVHGVFVDANSFLLVSKGVEPRNYASFNASAMTRHQLNELLAHDHSKNSLPFLLLNFGHEVWLLNRRGSRQSLTRADGVNATLQQTTGPDMNATITAMVNKLVDEASSPNANLSQISSILVDSSIQQIQLGNNGTGNDSASKYWSFSLDEQAQYDLPETCRYIRNVTGRRRVSIVAHSTGGAITLMSLIRRPKFASKLNQILLWSPTINVGLHNYLDKQMFTTSFSAGTTNYSGPAPPLAVYSPLQTALANRCLDSASQQTVCLRIFGAIFGKESKHQQVLPGYIYNIFTPSSLRELQQVQQSASFGGMQHCYDFGTPEANKKAYGMARPPAYIFQRIASKKISFFVGKSDSFVSPKDIKATQNFLSVPATYQVIAGSERRFFNHMSYLINDNAGALVCLQSLRKLGIDS